MKNIEKAAYIAHSKTMSFKNRVNKTLDLLREFLKVADNPYIAFSTGKDSTVCLHLMRSLNPNIVAVYNDHQFLLPEMEEMLNNTQNIKRIARTVKHSETFTSYKDGKPESLSKNIEWVDGSIRKDWAQKQNHNGCVVGLRVDENSYRRKHVRKYGQLFFVKSYGLYNCYPVAYWNVSDIWAYIISNNIPYCKAYDVLSELNIKPQNQRIGPVLNEKVETMGQVSILKMGWPELFGQLCEIYPEINGMA